MNKRIKELEKQATETVRCGLNGTSTAERFNRKKFAELIVWECINVIGEENYTMLTGKAYCTKLKRHFGVEE